MVSLPAGFVHNPQSKIPWLFHEFPWPVLKNPWPRFPELSVISLHQTACLFTRAAGWGGIKMEKYFKQLRMHNFVVQFLLLARTGKWLESHGIFHNFPWSKLIFQVFQARNFKYWNSMTPGFSWPVRTLLATVYRQIWETFRKVSAKLVNSGEGESLTCNF